MKAQRVAFLCLLALVSGNSGRSSEPAVAAVEIPYSESAIDPWSRMLPADSAAAATAAADTGGGGLERTRAASRLQAQDKARRLRSFSTDHADHPMALEARRQEALALLQAGLLGDDTEAARRDGLVVELLGDSRLSADQRCEIAAYAGQLEVFRGSYTSIDELVAAQEQMVRRLLVEFPESSSPGLALLSMAEGVSDERARAVARELLTSCAPETVKNVARERLARGRDAASSPSGPGRPLR